MALVRLLINATPTDTLRTLVHRSLRANPPRAPIRISLHTRSARFVLCLAGGMTAIDFIVQPSLDPALSTAIDRHLMRVVGRRSRPRNAILRVYGLAGDAVALGRYHLAPLPPPTCDVSIFRRHSGGRVLPAGDGFVGLSLILPHRSALFGDDPYTLAPYQVLNRYVRGILAACQLAHVSALYPGRDFVTVDRRVLAAVSFETDENGTLLFEASVSAGRDFTALPALLDRVDPEGTVRVQLFEANGATSLARELRTRLSFEEVADLLGRGFAKQFGIQLEPSELSPLERQLIETVSAREDESQWLLQRGVRPDLDHHASLWVQLGVLEVYLALQQAQFIKDIMFVGDFIANSPAIEALERRLRLCPCERRAIEEVAGEIFSDPANFILGIGKVRTVADVILRAVGA